MARGLADQIYDAITEKMHDELCYDIAAELEVSGDADLHINLKLQDDEENGGKKLVLVDTLVT